jgi:uncharacterized protein (DUF2147 family)
MLRTIAIAISASLMLAGAALADPIEGNWTVDSGETAQIAAGGGGFVITLRTGKYSGKRIGQMSATGGGKYKGKITDPADDKTYSGNATLNGNSLAMQGCVLAVLCRTQNWKRQ